MENIQLMMACQNLNLQKEGLDHAHLTLVQACGVISDNIMSKATMCTQLCVLPAGHLELPEMGIPVAFNRQ